MDFCARNQSGPRRVQPLVDASIKRRARRSAPRRVTSRPLARGFCGLAPANSMARCLVGIPYPLLLMLGLWTRQN